MAIKAFFGDNPTFYGPLVTTKADVEHNILYLQQRLTFDDATLLKLYEDKDITDVTEIKQHINRIIEELKKKTADTPEESSVIKELGIRKGISAKVDFGKDFMGHVSCSESCSWRPQILCYAFGDEHESARYFKQSTSAQVDINSNNPKLTSAKQAAQKLIDDMGIDGVQLGDVYVSLDNAWGDRENGVVSDRVFYIFCFERVVGDRTIDFTFYEGMLAENDFDKPVPCERMEVWTSGDKVVKFKWLNPINVTEIINENTAIQIDYEQALDIAVNHIGRTQTQGGEITGIGFEMVRIKEKDTNNCIVVPAWKIYGDVEAKFCEEFKDRFNIDGEFDSYYKNILTDGSVIDMEKGY